MNGGQPWHAALAAPSPGQHFAQLYTESAFLARAVSRFIVDGLRAGEGVIVIATPQHWDVIARHLERARCGFEAAQLRGQLEVLDAAECLAMFVVDDMPDRDRFLRAIGGVVAATRAAGYARIRAFGEMVDLLRHTSVPATLRLEELWGELLATHGISLLCGYSLDNFDRHHHRGLLQQVSAVHSDLIPVEDYARLERAVDRAYVDVFGATGDVRTLREMFLTHFARPAAMPDAEAAILAAREFAPTTADILLDRVRHHYTTPSPRA
jgi:hypothetical protein